jgi:hypothetical protein
MRAAYAGQATGSGGRAQRSEDGPERDDKQSMAVAAERHRAHAQPRATVGTQHHWHEVDQLGGGMASRG